MLITCSPVPVRVPGFCLLCFSAIRNQSSEMCSRLNNLTISPAIQATQTGALKANSTSFIADKLRRRHSLSLCCYKVEKLTGWLARSIDERIFDTEAMEEIQVTALSGLSEASKLVRRHEFATQL